jgi:ketosteroid isomerase-like protein
MKLLLTLFCCAGALVAADATPKSEKEVLAAMEAWKKATMTKDKAALEKLLHEDLSYTHSNALNESKADVIRVVTTGKSKTEAIEFLETTVRVYGNTALVKGKVDITNNVDGKSTANHLNVLHVWVKGSGGWQLVGRQAVRLPAA